MGNSPLVTVLVTAHNASRYIAPTIESIQAQTFGDFELLVVDDASEDSTPAILEKYKRREPRMRVVRRETRGGPYVAANHGFSEARGFYVARSDSDDVSLPNRLEHQLEFLSENPGLRACATEIDLLVDDEPATMTTDALPTGPATLKWRACVREMFMPSTTLIERSAWKDVGRFRELALSQDLRFWCDLSRRNWLGVVPRKLVYWRRHESQLSTKERGTQESLAMDVIRDHLCEMDGMWTAADTYRLRWAAFRPVGLRDGRRVLDRFEALWKQDATLSDVERVELEELMRWLRRRHMRTTLKEALRARKVGRALLRVRAQALTS